MFLLVSISFIYFHPHTTVHLQSNSKKYMNMIKESVEKQILLQLLIPVKLHDIGVTFAPVRIHSGSLSSVYICLHDTTTKFHASASHPGVSSARLLYRSENFTPVRNFATVSCNPFRCEIGLPVNWNW